MDNQFEATFAELKLSSRVSLAMILIALILLIGSVIYSYSATRLSPLEQQLTEKKAAVDQLRLEIQQATNEKYSLNVELNDFRSRLEFAKKSGEKLQQQINDLGTTQNDLLDFLSQVTDREQVSILDPTVDWNAVKSELASLPSGKRKQTLLTAILLAWKEIPFSMGRQTLIQREVPVWQDGGVSKVQRLALDKRSLNSESATPGRAWESTRRF